MKESKGLKYYGILLLGVAIYMLVMGIREDDLLLMILGSIELVLGVGIIYFSGKNFKR